MAADHAERLRRYMATGWQEERLRGFARSVARRTSRPLVTVRTWTWHEVQEVREVQRFFGLIRRKEQSSRWERRERAHQVWVLEHRWLRQEERSSSGITETYTLDRSWCLSPEGELLMHRSSEETRSNGVEGGLERPTAGLGPMTHQDLADLDESAARLERRTGRHHRVGTHGVTSRHLGPGVRAPGDGLVRALNGLLPRR